MCKNAKKQIFVLGLLPNDTDVRVSSVSCFWTSWQSLKKRHWKFYVSHWRTIVCRYPA